MQLHPHRIPTRGLSLHRGFSASPLLIRLVALTDQVVGKSLDGSGSIAGDLVLVVVTNNNGLLRLDDRYAGGLLASVDATVLGLGHDVSFAADVEAVGKSSVLGGSISGDNAGNGGHLGGLEL